MSMMFSTSNLREAILASFSARACFIFSLKKTVLALNSSFDKDCKALSNVLILLKYGCKALTSFSDLSPTKILIILFMKLMIYLYFYIIVIVKNFVKLDKKKASFETFS